MSNARIAGLGKPLLDRKSPRPVVGRGNGSSGCSSTNLRYGVANLAYVLSFSTFACCHTLPPYINVRNKIPQDQTSKGRGS